MRPIKLLLFPVRSMQVAIKHHCAKGCTQFDGIIPVASLGFGRLWFIEVRFVVFFCGLACFLVVFSLGPASGQSLVPDPPGLPRGLSLDR